MPHDPCTSPSPAGDRWRILVVDADRRLASSLAEWLCGLGHHASAAGNASEAVRMIGRVAYDICLVDALLPDDGAARVTVALRAHAPRAALIRCLPTSPHDPARLQPADGTLVKPHRDEDLLAALASASRAARVRGEACLAPRTQPRDLLGDHPTMRHALDVAARIAATPATVLITGESGTGKSLLARHIHAASGRAGRFVDVACGSLAESLLDRELFGHVPGAFTGATARRDGRFLLADGGTIFLDEITTASPAMQVKLLRVLQERQFEPLGGRDTITIDARVILATNDDLSALVASGRFRADLFWRIAVVTIAMPPLRERADDIPTLAAHFLTAAAARAGRRVEGFTPRAIEALRAHRWPGNVRELEHAVERAVLLGRDAVVDLPDLPSTVASGSIPAAPATHRCGLKHDLAGPERRLILDALENAGWRRDTAARSLGINRTTLYKKLKRLGIDLADVAPSR
ncbi:MAG: sigma 54-interacting transcriptional regulator [Planctomycetaceae bacterium]